MKRYNDQIQPQPNVRLVQTAYLDSVRQKVTALRTAPPTDLNPRLTLLEKQIDALLKVQPDSILLAKDNQIDHLLRSVALLKQKLRRSQARESELQTLIKAQQGMVQLKQQMIQTKDCSLQAQYQRAQELKSQLRILNRNLEANKHKMVDVWGSIYQGIEVKKEYQLPASHRNRISQLCNDLQRLVSQSQEPTTNQIEHILQSFMNTLPETKLYSKMRASISLHHTMQEYARLRENFAVASAMWKEAVKGGIAAENLFTWLSTTGVTAVNLKEGVFVEQGERVVYEDRGDTHTKQVLAAVCVCVKQLTTKYPKLVAEIPPTVRELIEGNVGDCQRVVEIVRYVPQVVRVQDTVVRGSMQQSIVQILKKNNISADVIEQIMVVWGSGNSGNSSSNNPTSSNSPTTIQKIVEVQKIVQKIVERVIEVPQVVVVQKIVQRIVQVQRIKQVPRTELVYVDRPCIVTHEIERIVEVPHTIEKVVEVERIVQRIVQVIREVPKVVEVEVEVERVVEVEVVREVEHIVNHLQQQVQQIQVFIEKLIPVQKIVQRIVQVPVYREKIVERVVQRQKIVEVERVVEKVVPMVEYRNAKEVVNQIETRVQIVERVVERIVPVERVVERLVEVDRVVEKVVVVVERVVELVEVEKIREVVVERQKIVQVERVVEKVVERVVQVIKEVEKVVRVPFIEERIRVVQEIVEKAVLQRVETTKVVEVVIREPLVVYQTRVLEVERVVNHVVEVVKLVRYVEEKIVEVPKTVDRIKEVRVVVEKIFEKMVEVPKVVEVERVVEKVVVVPRVVEKVVEVQKIVEKVVEKEVEKVVIREVEKIVQVPVIMEKIIQMPVERVVYVPVYEVVDRVVDKLVEVKVYHEEIKVQQVVVEKMIEVVREVPKVLEVTHVVPQIIDNVVAVDTLQEKIVPYVIYKPIEIVSERLVPVERVQTRVETVPQIVEKIVARKEQVIRIEEIEKIVERIVIEQRIKEVEKIIPYYTEVIREIPTIVEKIVAVRETVQEIVSAERVIEKVVEKTIHLTNLMEVERIRDRLIEVPKIIEIKELIPQLVYVNKYIEHIVEKLVEIPLLIEKLKEVEVQRDRIVLVREEVPNLIEINNTLEKIVYVERIKEVVRAVNQIEQVLKIVDRFQGVPYPVHTFEERIVEVPILLEKIVEKIVIMPQIVQVLRYVHEITEQQSLICTSEDASYEMKYKQMTHDIRNQIQQLQRSIQSKSSVNTEALGRFLVALDQHIQVPRVVCVGDQSRSRRMEMSLTVLSEKLIRQLKRIQKLGVEIRVDKDIAMLFMNNSVESDVRNVEEYGERVRRQFAELGPWTAQQQHMLTTYIQERYEMAQMVHRTDHSQNILQQKQCQIQQLKLLLGSRKESRVENAFEGERIAVLQRNLEEQLQRQHQQYQKDIQSQRSLVLSLEQQVSELRGANYNLQQEIRMAAVPLSFRKEGKEGNSVQTKAVTSASLNPISPVNEYSFATPESNKQGIVDHPFLASSKTLYQSPKK